jgi:hypothetical protein
MSEYVVIRDPDTGEPLMSVCVPAPLTDDEMAALTELALWMRDHGPTLTAEQGARQDAAIARVRRAAGLSSPDTEETPMPTHPAERIGGAG